LFRLSILFIVLLVAMVAKASSTEFFGIWHCKQSYQTEGNMYFESEYIFDFKKDSSISEQHGFISLTSQIDLNKVSKVEYRTEANVILDSNQFEITPIQITASVVENSLGLIDENFIKKFTLNRQTYKGIFEIINEKSMTSTYENGEVVSCEKKGL
jgi:hypothetical protein